MQPPTREGLNQNVQNALAAFSAGLLLGNIVTAMLCQWAGSVRQFVFLL